MAGVDQRCDEAILDAAVRSFVERGFAPVTMGDIARQAGIEDGALLERFRDKRDILIAIVDRAMAEGRARLLREIAAAPDEAVIRVVASHFRNDPFRSLAKGVAGE